MSVPSIRGVVEAAIQRASAATGVDFTFLMRTAKRESGFNPTAKAPTSSAAGLYQFVDQTWLGVLKQHGAKYGYARYADLIQTGPGGRYHVQGEEARQAVMALRLDPHAAALMAGEMAADHASYLRGRVGRDPTAGELYVAHFLGPKGSAKLIEAVRASPGASAASLFPEAAHSNRNVFFRDGRAATVSEVYANLTTGQGESVRDMSAAPAAPADPDGGFIQYASARQTERQREEEALVDVVLRGPQSFDDPTAGASSGAPGAMFSSDMLQILSQARARDRSS